MQLHVILGLQALLTLNPVTAGLFRKAEDPSHSVNRDQDSYNSPLIKSKPVPESGTKDALNLMGVDTSQSKSDYQPPPFKPTEIRCPIIFDGRVPFSADVSLFDTPSSPFNPHNYRSRDLLWSSTLKFPAQDNHYSRFANPNVTKPVEVTITSRSIIDSDPGPLRSSLVFAKDNPAAKPKGVRTLHFSILQDLTRSLHRDHEYINVRHESPDSDIVHFSLISGTVIGQPVSHTARDTHFKVFDRTNTQIWHMIVDITGSVWQNFGVVLDYDYNTIQLMYSTDDNPLVYVTDPLPNNNAGIGQFTIGILRAPLPAKPNGVYPAYQAEILEEGQIYDGLFVEDSTGGCFTL